MKTAVQIAYKEEDVLAILWAKKLRGMSLRDIADGYTGVTYGDISRALHGVFPKNREKRRALMLVDLQLAETCPIHGIVHLRSTCPTDGRQPRRRWVRCAGHAGGGWE